MSPAEFIPIAEETGQIIAIGELVIDMVLEFIHQLIDTGIDFDSISLNLSPIQMKSEDNIRKLKQYISSNQSVAQKLSMEITENVFIDNTPLIDRMMLEFIQYGVRFYLDDFGTGYSNITSIISLPFEYVKIDKSILYESIVNPKSHTLLMGLCQTFSDIGLKLVIEGVENSDQERVVLDIKAECIQGFMFARPVPAIEAMKYLGNSPESI